MNAKFKVVFFKGTDPESSWHWVVRNTRSGRAIARSSEAKSKRIDAVKDALSVLNTDEMDLFILAQSGDLVPFIN